MIKRCFKKMIAAAAAGALTLSLMACGGGGSTGSTAAESTKTESTKTESTKTESTKTESAAAGSTAAESSAAESLPAEESFAGEGEDVIVGGWRLNTEGTAVEGNPDLEDVFSKAVEPMKDYRYEAAAILATQLVSGTNYCFLARKCAAAPDAKPTFELLYVYRDFSGNASVLQETELIGEGMLGSFEVNDGAIPALENENVKNAFDKAAETLLGVNYEPVAYLAKQIVNGTNYMILCRTQVVSPEAVPEFSLVTIYESLDGNAKFGESEPIEIGVS